MKMGKSTMYSVNTLEQLKSNFNLGQELDIQSMNKIRGGHGEDDGGGDVIIIPPKPIPNTTSNASSGTNTSTNTDPDNTSN